jgi:hypothetical protein
MLPVLVDTLKTRFIILIERKRAEDRRKLLAAAREESRFVTIESALRILSGSNQLR